PAPLVCTFGAGVIDEDSAHGLGRGPHEVSAAVEALVADQPQVRFVNQRGGLEGLAGLLLGHPRRRELPRLVVDELQQLRGGLAVTGLCGLEQAGHVGHSAECNGYGRQVNGKSATDVPSDLSPAFNYPQRPAPVRLISSTLCPDGLRAIWGDPP